MQWGWQDGPNPVFLQSACGVTGDFSTDFSQVERQGWAGGCGWGLAVWCSLFEALNAPETFARTQGAQDPQGVLLFLKSRFFPKDDSKL